MDAITLEATPDTLKTRPNFTETVEAFLASLDLSDNTIKAYRRGLTNFFTWMADSGKAVPTRSDIRQYRDYLKDTYKESTAGLYMSSVRCFFQGAADEAGRPELNIAARIRSPKKPKGHAKLPMTANQAARVLEASDGDSIKEKRNHAMTSIAVYGGLRCIELSRLDIEDMRKNPNGTALLDVWGKGRTSKDRKVPIAPEAVEAVEAYIQAREALEGKTPSGALFVSTSNRSTGERLSRRSVSKILKDAMKAVGIDDPKLTAHSYRHSCADFIIEGGGSVHDVQMQLGHQKMDTSLIYIHEHEERQSAATLKISDLLKSA